MSTPVISSVLDTDLYKFTMGQVVFNHFPDVQAQYTFINRNKTPFPDDFERYLRQQIWELSWMRLSDDEFDWFKSLPYIKPTYAEWVRGYRFDPKEVKIHQSGGELHITVEGPWYRTILWEVPLMAMISELYFAMTGYTTAPDWEDRISLKAMQLQDAGCRWSDFGTRRRFSKKVQARVVAIMSAYKGFIGTSNPQLAKLYNVNPVGTSAHEAVMAMGALYGVEGANMKWMDLWRRQYDKYLSIALTDTFTTVQFLREFGSLPVTLWDGVRQDSGNPEEWADRLILPHYRAILGHDPVDKKFVFSDNLNVPKAVALNNKYKDVCIPVFGIGTNLTNDVFTQEQYDKGARPLNMVIKLKAVNGGGSDGRWKGCVKLSDDKGKYTGDQQDINEVLEIVNQQPYWV